MATDVARRSSMVVRGFCNGSPVAGSSSPSNFRAESTARAGRMMASVSSTSTAMAATMSSSRTGRNSAFTSSRTPQRDGAARWRRAKPESLEACRPSPWTGRTTALGSRKQLVWGSEDTALGDHVERRYIADILRTMPPGPKTREAVSQNAPAAAGIRGGDPWQPNHWSWTRLRSPGGRWQVVGRRNGDYPLGVGGKENGGVVRVLTDTDGDGTYDTSTVFLTTSVPHGVLPWERGRPHHLSGHFYAEDTDGDGKADSARSLHRLQRGSQQHRVNGRSRPGQLALHANGDSGGTIKSLKTGKVVSMNGRDLRIKPRKPAKWRP